MNENLFFKLMNLFFKLMNLFFKLMNLFFKLMNLFFKFNTSNTILYILQRNLIFLQFRISLFNLFDFLVFLILFYLFYFILSFRFFFSIWFLFDFYLIVSLFYLIVLYLFILFKRFFFYKNKVNLLIKNYKNIKLIFINSYFLELLIKIFCWYFVGILILLLVFFKVQIKLTFYCFNLLILDYFILILKFFILIFFILILLFCKNQIDFVRAEFSILFGFICFSSSILISSYNFICFFVSLELFSISMLIIICSFFQGSGFYKNSLKYFVVNALASVFILIGIVLLYGSLGSFSLKTISLMLMFSLNDDLNYLVHYNCLIAFVFFFSGLFIKLGMAPFHFWVLDIYENLPYIILMFLLIYSKTIFYFILFYFINFIFFSFFSFFKLFFFCISILTLGISSILALVQTNLKRFIICISLFSSGILLFSLLPLNINASINFINFLFVDNCLFLFILIFFGSLKFKGKSQNSNFNMGLKNLYDLIFLQNFFTKFFLSILLLMFSGLPPFGIFFLKFNIIQSFVVDHSWFSYSIIFLLFSSINMFTYLRIIKMMFFFNKKSFIFSICKNKYYGYFVMRMHPLLNFFLIFFFFFIIVYYYYYDYFMLFSYWLFYNQ